MLAGANPNCVLDADDEDLSVSDLSVVARAGGLCELADHGIDNLRLHHRLDLQSRPQGDVDRRTPVPLGVTALRAAALDLRDGHTGYAALVQHVLDLLQPLMANDRDNHLHAGDPSRRA